MAGLFGLVLNIRLAKAGLFPDIRLVFWQLPWLSQVLNFVNLLHSNISIHILHTPLYISFDTDKENSFSI